MFGRIILGFNRRWAQMCTDGTYDLLVLYFIRNTTSLIQNQKKLLANIAINYNDTDVYNRLLVSVWLSNSSINYGYKKLGDLIRVSELFHVEIETPSETRKGSDKIIGRIGNRRRFICFVENGAAPWSASKGLQTHMESCNSCEKLQSIWETILTE